MGREREGITLHHVTKLLHEGPAITIPIFYAKQNEVKTPSSPFQKVKAQKNSFSLSCASASRDRHSFLTYQRKSLHLYTATFLKIVTINITLVFRNVACYVVIYKHCLVISDRNFW